MLRNYFKTAWRALRRSRQSTLINIFGLALGIAVFLLIIQYVAFEWSANRFHKNFDQLYRVNNQGNEAKANYYEPPGFAPYVKDKIAGIQAYVRIADGVGSGVISSTADVSQKEKIFREDNILYVDSNFFNVFSFPLIAGATRLPPKTLALSQRMSDKLFGNNDAVGRTIIVSNQFGNTPYSVTAVYKNMPENSDIAADILLSFQTLDNPANRDENDWADPAGTESGFVNIYLQLEEHANADQVAGQITSALHRLKPETTDDKIVLQPLSRLHLAPSFNYPFQTYGSLTLVTVFSVVALLILFIAWINYINLSTAQALNRAREVGVRKVLGASRTQLIMQYLGETCMVTLISVALAFLLVYSIQPFYNSFSGKQLSLGVLNNGWFWLAGSALILISSTLSGTYVAFILSDYKPVTILRGKSETTGTRFSLRKGLVVFQFTISIVFIIATIVLYRQLQYMQTQQLGMNLNQLLVIKGPTVSSEAQAERNMSFKNTLAQLPFVKKYAASNNVPGGGYNFSTEKITRLAAQKGDERKNYSMFISDEKFFDTYGIHFLQGQTYTARDAERAWMNSKKVIINEKAAASLGFRKDEPVAGQKLLWDGVSYEIAGVVKDYHHLSLREAIKPTVYLPSVSFAFFTLQTDSRNLPAKLETLKKLYNRLFPGNPFDYFFADESFDKQYSNEQQLGSVFIASATVAILIACLGLFGLVSFSARQRIKEIGIRKVLGASVKDITTLLSKDFIKLVLVSILIASPVAWWLMHNWLKDFAYRTDISWWIFVVAGVIAVFIAVTTVSFQAIKAARANPVKNLRTE